MSRRTLAIVVAGLLLSLTAHAQDDRPDETLVQKLLGDPKALAEALKHCDPAATTADRDCRAAQEAQNRKFFGADPQYTPQKVDPFPNSVPLTPSPRKP
jgi:conjugative transfer region protein TrbK